MNDGAKLAVALLPVCLLSACTPALLAPDERQQVCAVRVDEMFGSPVVAPNPLSNPAGAVVGAAGGMVGALPYSVGPQAIILVPLGAVVGATAGAVCAAASLNYPDAEVKVQTVLAAAAPGSLKRAMEADLNAPRAGCARPPADPATAIVPDTIVEVRKVEVTLGCLFGKQEYWIAVDWKVRTAIGQRVLAETTTRCHQKSTRDVDEWLAVPEQAKAEVEHTLGKIGQRMAAELLSPTRLTECRL